MAAEAREPPRGAPAAFLVGPWRVDPARNELARDGQAVHLEPKVIEVLACLAQRPGEVMSRDEILAAVWPGVVVGDDALTQAIIKLRRALGDDAHRPTYIETISKRGYRLIAPVTSGAAPERLALSAPAASRRAAARPILLVAAGFLLAVAIVAALTHPQLRVVSMPWPLGPDARGNAAASTPIVAVLPLANLSGDPRRDYFSDGITEDIIGALGRFSGLRVMSRNAVQGLKGKSPALQALREELGARYIVRGTVREEGSRVRVAVELSDADKGAVLWADRFDAEGAQLFEVQDRIVRNIAGALHVRLTQVERERVFSQPTDNLEAHDLVLRARALLWEVDRRANRQARELLARAAALAPGYSEIGLAQGEAEIQRALYGWVEEVADSMKRAEEHALRVVGSGDARSHARAHVLLARVYSNLSRPEDALRHAELAVAANPSDSGALYYRGAALLYVGRVEEGVAVMESARRLDGQMNASFGLNLAAGYYIAERYRESVVLAEELLARFPREIGVHAIRVAALSQLGEPEKAREGAQAILRLSPEFDARNMGLRFARPEHRTKFQEGLRKAGL